MSDFNLDVCDSMFKTKCAYTYRNFALNHYSFIDHFVVSSSLIDNIKACECTDSGANLSDHIPVTILVKCTDAANDNGNSPHPQSHSPKTTKLRWDKLHGDAYYNSTREELSAINAGGDIDGVYQAIKSSVFNLPQLLTSLKQLVIIITYKFWWDDKLIGPPRPSLLIHILYESLTVALVLV